MARLAPLRLWAPPAVLAGMTVALGFHAGGFFVRPVGVAAVVLAILMALRVAVARQPVAGIGRPSTIAIAAILLLAAWTLASSLWSGAGFRALTQADRVLLYAFALVFFGSWARTEERLSMMLRGAVLAFLVLCVAGLISRLVPDVWTVGVQQRSNRLQYPVTYANSMGLLAALGLLWSFALSAGARESPLTRVAAAAAVPVFVATLLLTYSRGAIGAFAVGFAALVLLGGTRAMLNAALATVVPAVAAGFVTFRADALATTDYTSAGALSEGHRVAVVLAIAAGGAALLRAALLAHDERVLARAPAVSRRVVIGVAVAAAVAAVATLAIAIDLPRVLSQQHDRFQTPQALESSDVRDRLADPGSSDRLDAWRVALQDFRAEPIHGRGAGTFVLSWNERRPTSLPFNETHSLYLQMLGELGIVGLVLMLIVLWMMVVVPARRARGAERTLYAAVAAGVITWALAAAVDWQWQMPVGTLAVFALGATALAARRSADPPPVPWPALLALAVAVVAIAVVPARAALSERSVAHAAAAFKKQDCRSVVPAARDAARLVAARPEPYELLAYCHVIEGDARQALRDAARAVDVDPDNWRCRYTLALVRAATGRDPRPAVRSAARINPLEPLVVKATSRFRGSDPAQWRLQAQQTPIFFEYGL
jgi:hypothetical protein